MATQSISMLEVLSQIEVDLPNLLQFEDWPSLDITYHPPIVERLWRPWREYRIYLHRIHPCSMEEALYHPHPWPSAMRILKGEYEMIVGYGSGDIPPRIAARLILRAGSRYEMAEPDGWHAVRPVDQPSLSLMVTGPPWKRLISKSNEPRLELSEAAKAEILDQFKRFYS